MFDAILIDEAQDWAPNWIKIINRMVNPEHGVIFLADDPSQSIYRSFSWKEKGINVAGRTRWLRIPYRNTQEIYQAAYAMIADRADIQASLAEEGELVRPDMVSTSMRHGLRPLIQKCASVYKELEFIKNKIQYLRQDGYKDHQIAVLVRYTNSLKDVQNAMKGYDVRIHPIHGFKGLEVDAVFIPHLQKTFQREEEEYITAERRIIYMAMTRARKQLCMTYFGKLPRPYEDLRHASLVDFVG
jgi:superfamily I DNA/RNA helicase